MDVIALTMWVTERVQSVINGGGEVVTMLGDTPGHGRIPVGVVTLEYHGKIAYPHALWFPDASPRNKLEIGLAFFLELKKDHTGMVFSAAENEGYFNHLCTYGLLRKVGKVRDWYEDKVHATLYQTVGN